jgi:Chitobiase/beta-hexosaminidase C-terminal domain
MSSGGRTEVSNVSARTRVARRRTRAIISTAAALTAAVALAAPAGAAVNGSHVVAAIPGSSTLELSGYSPGAHLTVQAIRNGTVIGSALTDVLQDGSAGVNPVACWQGSTSPQLLPGDTISVAGDGATDTMTVEDVGATSLEIDPVTGNILVHGFARALGGGPLDPATFSASVQARVTAARGSAFSNGRLAIRAGAGKFDGTVAQDAPGSTTWTATFPPTGNDAAIAANAKDFEGVYLIGLSELTIGRLPVAAVAAGCGPIQQNGVSSFDRAAVNASNVGTNLVVNGVVQPDATSVDVTVTDGTKTLGPVTVTPTNGLFKATFPAADVTGLAEGTLTASATITTPAQTFTGASQTILKDTQAPPPPVASPSGGTFSTSESVRLGDDDATAKVHYTTVGTAPGAASPVFGTTPITVDHSMTIRAIAIDAAGNVSAEGLFAFTIVAPPSPPSPPSPPAGGGGPVSGSGGTTIIQQIPLVLGFVPAPSAPIGPGVRPAPAPARPAVHGLSVAVLRGHALRVGMGVDRNAAVVRVQVFRARRGAPSGRALFTAVRLPVGGGRFVVTLRGAALRSLRKGSYVLEARAGVNRGTLGVASRRAFRVS